MAEAESRRAKKRQTDRDAQRQHRKRQKQYIEGLEAQISLLKSAGTSEASQLAARNLALQNELQQMHDLWDEMQNILHRQRELRRNSVLNLQSIPSDGCPTPSDDSNNGKDSGTRTFAAVPSDTANDAIEVHPLVPDEPMMLHDTPEPTRLSDLDDLTLHDTAPIHDISDDLIQSANLHLDDNFHLLSTQGDTIDVILGDEPQLVDIGNLDKDGRITAGNAQPGSQIVDNDGSEHFYTTDSDSAIQGQTRRLSYGNDSACAIMNRQMKWPTNTSTTTQKGNQFLTQYDKSEYCSAFQEIPLHEPDKQHALDPLDGFTELFDACLQHNLPALRPNSLLGNGTEAACRDMSTLIFPSIAKDKFFHEMIERASQTPDSIGPPALVDFLVDNKQNPLSTDLKAYLEPIRKTRRTSEYLATYWVLYLLLRWQILRSEDAYHSLPPWLRPTPLQLVVHHPVVADLIAWPGIREGLIYMSMSDSQHLHDISADVGKYLTVDISMSESDLLRDPQQIVSKILDLKNWKLDGEFFNRYPQWKNDIA